MDQGIGTCVSMGDFKWVEDKKERKWIVLAPRRASRPQEHESEAAASGKVVDKISFCPFCPGRESLEKEVFRVGEGLGVDWHASNASQSDAGWMVRVIPNKYPFARIHEIIVHSPDHHKNFDELPFSQVEKIIEVFRNRYNEHSHTGNVYIFHNHLEPAGESLPHPHTQLVVIPFDIAHEIPGLDNVMKDLIRSDKLETSHFQLFCPDFSPWPDEVWLSPKKRNKSFGEITDREIGDFSMALSRLIKIFTLRYGHSFPYNFYISPGDDWYLRLIPRVRILGGFEVGTGIFVNTQDPKETFAFVKEHFVQNPDEEKIKREHQAKYHKTV